MLCIRVSARCVGAMSQRLGEFDCTAGEQSGEWSEVSRHAGKFARGLESLAVVWASFPKLWATIPAERRGRPRSGGSIARAVAQF